MFDMSYHNPVESFQYQRTGRHSSRVNPLSQARQWIGRQVKINRDGPESVEGILLAVNGEVFVLDSSSTIIYVNGRHVKSITEGTSQGASRGAGGGGKSAGRRSGQARGRSGMAPAFIPTSNFSGVLSRLRQQFVQINRGGTEKLEGFLADTNADFILLIVGREFVRVPVYHIKTVNLTGKNQSGGNKNNKSNNQNQSGSSRSGDKRNRSNGSSRSKGNRSGGSRSGGSRSGGNRSGGNRNRNRNRGGSRKR